jgi:ribonuclease BN (tRNA processing enzyme)/isopentenyl phosphate kinase
LIKSNITLIKLGGSLITYKDDEQRIKDYLDTVDMFQEGSASLEDLTEKIIRLHNIKNLKDIFQVIKGYLQSHSSARVIIVHGAGSIGHSLVLHLLQNDLKLEENYTLVKLAVSIQNQLIVSLAIRYGLNAISCSNHQIMLGFPTSETSTSRIDAPDLSVLETIIKESSSIPIFYGDVGFTHPSKQETKGTWKVFSGDLIPSALVRRFVNLDIGKTIFLTKVEGKKTGVYSTDPKFPEAKLITRVEVSSQKVEYFDENNEQINFETGINESRFDVTDAMEGKLRNIIDLAGFHTKSYVIGIEDLVKALQDEAVGTVIINTEKPDMNVIFLGIGDAFSSGGFKSAGILLELSTKTILLDCGPHALQTLKASGRKTIDIDWIVITHFHGDHFGGIPYFLIESIFQHNRMKPLTIIGPPGIENAVSQLFSTIYKNEAMKIPPFPCIYREITPSRSYDEDSISIKAYPMNHTPEAQGYRIEFNSKVIAYTGDTGWTKNLFSLTENADLAILECNFFESQFETHLNWQEINRLISHPKKLAAIHLGNEVVRELFSIQGDKEIIIPLEGQVIRI